MDDLLADFVAETREMLEASAGEIVAWEANPADSARLDTIFRFVHTVKGNCGFFDLPRLATLSHAAEDALSDCRSGKRQPDQRLVTAVLAIIDRIVVMVDAIDAGEDLPNGGDEALIAALEADGVQNADATAAANTFSQSNTAEDKGPAQNTKRADGVGGQRSIRLPVDLLDRVMSGVSDMVLARNDLAHRLRQAGTQPMIDGPFERLTAILSDVRDAITRMRMQRIETLFNAFPRLVRDLSNDLGKQVMIDLEGGDVELDREMIETIRDPLTHIIRNSIDHGIEPPSERLSLGKPEIGFLSITARQSGNMILVVVSDDGRGLCEDNIADKAVATGLITKAQRAAMNRDAILQLVFQPGFSTAETVSNISGRGVGLDVVRQNLGRVGGTISVKSTKGVGSQFTLQIPLTLSIIAGLTVETSGQRFAIPQSYIDEIIHSSSKALDFTRVGETALVTFRGKRVPCLHLHKVLGLPPSTVAESEHTMVMLRLANGDLFALAVDGIHSHGDIVVKPLAPAVMKAGVYAGSTLLDDGQPVLLLDVTNIASEQKITSDLSSSVLQSEGDFAEAQLGQAGRAMLFKDFEGRRCAVRLELVQRIETIAMDAVDRTGTQMRAILDGQILPLAGLPKDPIELQKLRLLHLNDGTMQLLYAVRAVEEAIDLSGDLKPVRDEQSVEAVILVGDKATGEKTVRLLDGHDLFARFGEAPESAAKPVCRIPDGDWARTVLAPLVVSAGYDVASDSDAVEDVAIYFEDQAEPSGDPGTASTTPVVRLRDAPEASGDADTVYKYDREGLIKALRKVRRAGGTAT
ncbi:chemotaxis protein CheA [Erythrobacter longus]|uniref:Chemotaxis protein CheA n=1 Tax=Erythrobacter longus TaxID=1044 RepID=A0A074MX79_ERYLO|nr:chemotaxis protein CheA [Erythrobacter longus]KEO90207.1 chemotaxis protein CheA [Erythrobacter longus]